MSGANGYLHCPLCAFEFVKRETPCERGCPLARFCKLICCPNCHYEFPPQAALTTWWRRIFHCAHKTPPGDLFSLAELGEGEEAELVRLVCEKTSRRNTLALYGLVPGSKLFLQQKRPSYIVRVGETELALEAEIAREILVKRA
jgi:Fe2+ transport system protein FeoA